MSILSKIRNNISLVVGIIALSLVLFILSNFFDGFQKLTGGKPAVGEVLGEEVSYDDFYRQFSIRQDNMQAQGMEVDERTRGQLLDETWRGMVSEIVFDKEMAKVGLQMTSVELEDLFVGDNVSPIIRQYFTPPNGQFDKAKVAQYIKAMEELEDASENGSTLKDEEARNLDGYRDLKEYLARARKREQYLNMVRAGYVSSMGAAKQRFIEQNTRSNVSFLAVNYSLIPDSTVKVSDNDIRDYISRHAKEYKQEEEVYLSYVSINVKPSAEDTLRTKTRIAKKIEAFKAAAIDTAAAKELRAINELPAAIQDSVAYMAVGQVVGPRAEGATARAFKLLAKGAGDASYTRVRQILVRPAGVTKEDSAAARAKCAELAKQANGGTFAILASANSMDYGTASKGGDMGWIAKGQLSYMGDGIDKAIEGGAKGKVVGPIKSAQGYHLFYIADRVSGKFAVAEISETIGAGDKTKGDAYKQANVLASKATETGKIDAAAKSQNLNAMESGALKVDAKALPGVNGGRDIILWAVNKAKEGDVSEVFTVSNNNTTTYVVAQLTKKRGEGTKEVADVRQALEPIVRNELKAKQISEKLNGLSGDINAKSKAYAGAFVNAATDITFDTPSIPGIGNDAKVVGTICGLAKGAVSKPIQGQNGVYIVQVTDVVAAQVPAAEILKGTKESDATQGSMQLQNKIEQALSELGKVKDLRHKAEL